MANSKEHSEPNLTYEGYLGLDKLLTCQHRLTPDLAPAPVHDEQLFITVHQAYELWFKQVLFEIGSIMEELGSGSLAEKMTLAVVGRLNRVLLILKHLLDVIPILETMTPIDFMDFRKYLFPASGFQSWQFRVLENTLGLKHEDRFKCNNADYKESFRHAPDIVKKIEDSASKENLLQIVQRWLETVFKAENGDQFWQDYQKAVDRWLDDEHPRKENEEESDGHKRQKESFATIFDKTKYNEYVANGERHFSQDSFKGAMLITFYRRNIRFQGPFKIMELLKDIESVIGKWRYNHVMMVHRVIGGKVGTGGSSGLQYVKDTLSDKYKPFVDLFNMSTYLIPGDYMPKLDDNTTV